MIVCEGVVLLTSAVNSEPQALAEVREGCVNNKDGIPHSFCPAGLNRTCKRNKESRSAVELQYKEQIREFNMPLAS